MNSDLILSFGIEDSPKSSLVSVPETARIWALRLTHGVGDFVLRSPFHKYCFPSLRGCNIVGKRLHLYVPRHLRVSGEQALGLVDIEDDEHKIQTRNGSVLRDFSRSIQVVQKCPCLGGAALGRETSVKQWVHKRKEDSTKIAAGDKRPGRERSDSDT